MKRFVSALLAAGCLLALPTFASAAQTVNTVIDEPDDVPGGECKTAANKCSLRAAIQVTNLAGVADNILFDATVFQGTTADAIALTEPLPAITAPVTINAGTCLTQAGVNGPCAGVTGPLNEIAASVTGAGVSTSISRSPTRASRSKSAATNSRRAATGSGSSWTARKGTTTPTSGSRSNPAPRKPRSAAPPT